MILLEVRYVFCIKSPIEHICTKGTSINNVTTILQFFDPPSPCHPKAYLAKSPFFYTPSLLLWEDVIYG